MDLNLEQRLVHNDAIIAEALWHSVFECYNSSANYGGMSFASAFLVPPIVFHNRSSSSLHNKKNPGALLRALSENPEIPVGLQKRMISMVDLTLGGLNLGLASGLFRLDDNVGHRLLPVKRTPIRTAPDKDIKRIFGSAKRLGKTFAELKLSHICTLLNVRY